MLQQTGRTITAALAFAALLLGTSCKKDNDEPGGGNPPAGKKITRFAVDANNYVSFSYNNDGKLSKMKSSMSFGQVPIVLETSFTYNGNKVKEVITSEGEKSVITYTGNYPSKSEDFDENNVKISYDEFTWNNGKLAQTITYEKEEGNTFAPDSKVTYEYHANGNLKTVKYYAYVSGDDGYELEYREEYEQYDNKFDPISITSNMTGIVDPSYRPNNPTLIKHYDAEGLLQATIEKIYEYDVQGYPTKLKEKHTEDGDTYEVNYTYTY